MVNQLSRPRHKGFILTAATWTAQRGRWHGPGTRPPYMLETSFRESSRWGCSLEQRETRSSAVGEGAISSRSFTALCGTVIVSCNPLPDTFGIKFSTMPPESKCTGLVSPRVFPSLMAPCYFFLTF